MAFLDAKERILDVVLTDRGRELLSQNLLDFEFYAFSDEGVDYVAAFTASFQVSGSADDFVRRNLMFEGFQKRNFKEQTDMSSFLYTVPPRQMTLPEFVTNFDSTLELSASRRFYTDRLSVVAQITKQVEAPIAVIAQGSAPQNGPHQNQLSYVAQQQLSMTQLQMALGNNVTGEAVAPGYVALNNQTALNVSSGASEPIEQIQAELTNTQTIVEVVSLSADVDVVSGLDRLKINLALKSSDGEIEDLSGYLVEVFESGSDGSIIKLFEENTVDVLGENTLRRGFEQDLFLDVDAMTEGLISEGERLRKKELRKRELVLARLQKQLRQKLKQSSKAV